MKTHEGTTNRSKTDIKVKQVKSKTLQAVRERETQETERHENPQTTAQQKCTQKKLKSQKEAAKVDNGQETQVSVDGKPTQTFGNTAKNNTSANNTSINQKSTVSLQPETRVSPRQRIQEPVTIKTKQTDIKSKDSYLKIHANTTPEIKTKETLMQSPHIISYEKPVIRNSRKNKIKTATTTQKVQKRRVFKTARQRIKRASAKATRTQKQVTKQAVKQAAKRAKQAAQQAAQATKATARTAVRAVKVVVNAAIAAAKAIVSAIASGGAIAVVLVVLIIVIIMAAIAASPFGIFISEEVDETGAIPLSQIIAEYNVELTQETEDIEVSVEHTEVEVTDNQTDTNVVIAVFAAKTAGSEDDTAEDVVIFDEAKAEKLKEYFRTANEVTYEVFDVTIDGETQTTLSITVNGKTKEELMDEYGLTAKQREAVETLLEHGDVLSSSSHSLAITDADVQSIIESLPDSLPQKRKDVVKNAGSLVGKVNYFWGGKSSAIGWDSAWGTMQRVTAEGSPSSGSIRAYGLDCSGFVTWVFNNSGMGYTVGHGTYGQCDASVQVTASSVQAGDLCFLPSYSHVGIVVGKTAGGSILVIHCSSGANNVVISTAERVGFTVFRRPNCY